MSLFYQDFSKPGPGVSPDAPRKRGIARWLEIVCRDFGRLWCSGALALASMLPLICAQLFQMIPMLVLSAIGGMLAAPQLCGLADTIMRCLRDEPCFWWHTYRRAWKRNVKCVLLPGALWGIITGTQLFTLSHFFDARFSLSMTIVLIIGLIIIQGVFLWVWPQVALLDIPCNAILKNSILLLLSNLGKSLGASLLVASSAALTVLFMPYSLVILLFVNIWPVMTTVWSMFYRHLDNAFDIEETIQNKEKSDKMGRGW